MGEIIDTLLTLNPDRNEYDEEEADYDNQGSQFDYKVQAGEY